jgi:hypothetical protein
VCSIPEKSLSTCQVTFCTSIVQTKRLPVLREILAVYAHFGNNKNDIKTMCDLMIKGGIYIVKTEG